MIAALATEPGEVADSQLVQLSGLVGSKDLQVIIRLLGDLRRTGSLQLARDGWSARLDFRDGRLVAAAFADESGLDGLASLAQVHSARFVYTESKSSLPIKNDADALAWARDERSELFSTCPKLGFADDPRSHFDRPSAVHRCFASGSVQPVSTLEQREFCLSGQYRVCPRLQNPHGAASQADGVGAVPPHVPMARLALDNTERRPWYVGEVSNGSRTPLDARVEPPPLPAPESMPPLEAQNPVNDEANVDENLSLIDRLLPPVSIALAIAAALAVFLVFVRPHLAGL